MTGHRFILISVAWLLASSHPAGQPAGIGLLSKQMEASKISKVAKFRLTLKRADSRTATLQFDDDTRLKIKHAAAVDRNFLEKFVKRVNEAVALRYESEDDDGNIRTLTAKRGSGEFRHAVLTHLEDAEPVTEVSVSRGNQVSVIFSTTVLRHAALELSSGGFIVEQADEEIREVVEKVIRPLQSHPPLELDKEEMRGNELVNTTQLIKSQDPDYLFAIRQHLDRSRHYGWTVRCEIQK